MSKQVKRWNIPVPPHLDRQLKEFIKKNAYKTQSEFIRTAVRDRLKEEFERLEKETKSHELQVTFENMNLAKIAKTLVSKGAKCIMCGTLFSERDIESYDHGSGISVKDYDKPQWVYMTCRKCHYQSALWKILNKFQRRAKGE